MYIYINVMYIKLTYIFHLVRMYIFPQILLFTHSFLHAVTKENSGTCSVFLSWSHEGVYTPVKQPTNTVRQPLIRNLQAVHELQCASILRDWTRLTAVSYQMALAISISDSAF